MLLIHGQPLSLFRNNVYEKKLNLAALLLAAALLGACGGQKQDAADTVAQTESAETENAEQKSSIDLADGVYTVDFKTDSSMFKVNESKKWKRRPDGQGWRGDTSYQPDLEKYREFVSGYCGRSQGR